MRIPFLGGSYVSQSVRADAERCVNFYPEFMESQNAATQVALYPTPGYELRCTFPTSPVRGLAAFNGRLFAVSGARLYEVFSDWTFIDRGAVATDAVNSPATFSSSGDVSSELFVTGGGNGYILNLTTNILTLVLTGTADFGGFVDGYFVALDAATSTLQYSNLADGLTWDALDVVQRNTASDPWVSMAVINREVRLFGQVTSDAYVSTDNTDTVFQPVTGSQSTEGVAGPYSSVALADQSVMWLSANAQGSGIVMRASGYVPVRVSTHAVEHAIQGYTQTRDAVAWSYQDQGHTFYVLNFPTMDATWVYDTVTGVWHERGWWDSANMKYLASRAQHHAYCFNAHVVGDRLTGGLYQQSIAYYNDIADVPLRRMRQGPHVSTQQRSLFATTAQLDLETGVGCATCTDPQIMLQWSMDGGHTWSNEHWTSAGAVGEYKTRAVWRRLGGARNRTFRVVVSDQVPWRLIDFYFDGVGGLS